MGRTSNFCCKTCKKNYYLGYGSYITWLDGVKDIQEFNKLESPYKTFWKNKNLESCLTEHEGHDFLTWSFDWASGRTGELIIETGYTDTEILVSDFGDYEMIDLWVDD